MTLDDHTWQRARQILTANQYRALVLKYQYGFSWQQMSLTLGISIPSCRSRVNGAISKLRKGEP